MLGEHQGQQAEDGGSHRGEGAAGSPTADQRGGDPTATATEQRGTIVTY